MAEWVELFAPEHFRVGVNFWVSSYQETTQIAGQMFVQKSTGIETMLGLTLHTEIVWVERNQSSASTKTSSMSSSNTQKQTHWKG